jgi:orotidine-5'-phosphate decarboxylase
MRGTNCNSKGYSVTQANKKKGGTLSFKAKIEETAKTKASRIVLALDFPFQNPENRKSLLTKAQQVLDAVHPHICAVKINHHLVLPLGTFNGVQHLIASIHEKGLPAIIDCKANDIGASNQVIAEYYYAAGFDALIANPFVGWEEGLKPIFDVAHKQQRGVILLAYMSHKGAAEGYGQTVCDAETGEKTPQYVSFAKKALSWGADGVVVGATVPEKIREIHEILGEKVPIYSPGIGAQGGAAEIAIKAGTRYLIVGREITLAQNSAVVAKKFQASGLVEKS